jgi:hypothetical protein
MLETTQIEPSGLAATFSALPKSCVQPNLSIALCGRRVESIAEAGRMAVWGIGGAEMLAGDTDFGVCMTVCIPGPLGASAPIGVTVPCWPPEQPAMSIAMPRATVRFNIPEPLSIPEPERIALKAVPTSSSTKIDIVLYDDLRV